MKILVTGGAGFIGANLIRRLSDDGVDHIVVMDDLSTGSSANLEGLDVEFHYGSILEPDLLARASRDVSSIVHLAARPSVPRSIADPLASHATNATGTLQVLEAARAVNAHVVLASSSSVYGKNPVLPKHEGLRPMPLSPYAASKLATESYALAYREVYGLAVLPFRFFNVYGPRQPAGHAYAAVVPEFVSRALSDQPLLVHGDGLQTRDFTFVDTVAEILSRAARERIESADSVNLAFGTRHSLLEVIALLEVELGRNLPIVHVETRAGDVRDSQAQRTELERLFPGVTPAPLAVGLAATVEWMRQELVSLS